MRRCLPLLLMACPAPTTRVAGVTVELHTPAAVDPLEGADLLVVRIIDENGNEVERAEAPAGSPLPVPPITWFGVQEVEITAQTTAGDVLAGARTGWIDVQPGTEFTLQRLFLPVNTAIKLDWTPNADRVGHVALAEDDDRILLIGGRQPSSAVVRTDSEWWSMVRGFDGEGPRITGGISQPGWARLDDDSVIIAGGDTEGGATASIFALTPTRDEIRDLEPMDRALTTPCIAGTTQMDAVILGGGIGHTYSSLGRTGTLVGLDTNGIEACASTDDFLFTVGEATRWGLFDLREAQSIADLPANVRWLPEVPKLTGPQVLALPDGRFWVGGGYGFASSKSTRVITPRGEDVDRGPDLSDFRVYGDAAVWRDEYVVLGGGFADQALFTPVRSVIVHHPDDGHVLSVPVPLRNPTMAVQAGGAVVLTGGLDDGGNPAGAWAVQPWVRP